MASGSQNMTTYNARTVTGSNSAASPAGALLLSGAHRANNATGDTWIFLDSYEGTSAPWGIKHDQVNNRIQIFGAGTNSVWTEMDTGNTYIGGSLDTGSTLTVRAQDNVHEGGEIILSPATDSFSTVHIDAYDSMFRLHDGTNERFKIDISTGNATINGNLGIGADYAVLGGSYKLYVNGSTYFNGDTTHNGIDYFANDTTYYIDNSAVAYLNDLRSDNVRLVENWIGFYQNANAGGNRYGYIQANADRMYFRKENGASTYHFDFNGHIYTTGGLYFVATDTTGTAPGIHWSGSTDSATIDYTVPSSDLGILRLNMNDDANARISFRNRDTEYAYVDGNGFRPISRGYSWLDGLKAGPINMTDANNTGSYWPWIRATNTASGRWFSFGTLGNTFYLIGSATSRTANGYDSGLEYDVSNGRLGGIKWLQVINDSSNNGNDALVYIQNRSASDWAMKIVKGSYNYGLRVESLDQGEAIWTNGYVRARCMWANQGSNGERQVGVDSSTSGTLFLFANTGGKGLYSSTGYMTGTVIGITSSARTFYGNCTGSAGSVAWGNVTGKPGSFTPSSHTHAMSNITWTAPQNCACVSTANNQEWSFDMNNQHTGCYWHVWSSKNGASCLQCFNDDRHSWAYKLYGAVWNDYAEFRRAEEVEYGRVVVEDKDKKMKLCNERLVAGAKISSDTFGISIGKSDEYNMPIAVSGRVLAFPYQERDKYELGAAVCSAPNGTVDIMTREEIMMYPERILGTVSEIPDYDIWYAGGKNEQGGGGDPVLVKGRIWIYVR